MPEQVENVTLPFAETPADGHSLPPTTDGALALSSESEVARTAALATANADAWGLTIPADFIPATKAQAAYWRELCGAISATGKMGMRDGAWPPGLAPTRSTLTVMAERGLIVRRGRAWRLKRRWYAWLQYLRQTAVATPALRITERPAPDLPTYAELKEYEAICRWLDGQPLCRARLPMLEVPGVGVVSALILQAMRKQKLVRHTNVCSWALASQWRALLLALWQGRTKLEGEQATTAAHDPTPGISTVLIWMACRPLCMRSSRISKNSHGATKRKWTRPGVTMTRHSSCIAPVSIPLKVVVCPGPISYATRR